MALLGEVGGGSSAAAPFSNLGTGLVGLSGILCARLVCALADRPLAEDNGALGLGLALTAEPRPLGSRPDMATAAASLPHCHSGTIPDTNAAHSFKFSFDGLRIARFVAERALRLP